MNDSLTACPDGLKAPGGPSKSGFDSRPIYIERPASILLEGLDRLRVDLCPTSEFSTADT